MSHLAPLGSRARARRLVALPLLALLAACASPPPLYEGLGDSGHAVTSEAQLAREYFDQGLALAWGFNHDEARRAFEHVERLDPACAMAAWGVAYTLGPNLNAPLMDPDAARRAHAEARRALAMAETPGVRTSAVERALIEAQVARFASPPPDDRGALDRAYASAMRDAWERFPDEPLVGVLYADALMNIDQSWRDWGTDEERGEHTTEIVATLERVLALAPDHAGANHFYIHAVEASPRPERGLPSARRLAALMPAAGHMVHMPGHIYMRLGMYEESIAANEAAVAADDAFFARAPRQGVYHLYRAHNRHFLAWSAMFVGARARAMQAAREMEARLPDDLGPLQPVLDAYRYVPMHVMMRFGMWDAMLAEPAPGEQFAVSTALWHHGRAIALANTGRFDAAREEAARFAEAAGVVREQMQGALDAGEPGAAEFAGEVLEIMEAADHVMWGEILFRSGEREPGLQRLRAGVAVEDELRYAEPPGWMQPIRHSLGALLLEAGQVEEAERVYREDLARYADNVWSLHGLAECLVRTGRAAEAEQVRARFAAASASADVEITASCYCREREG